MGPEESRLPPGYRLDRSEPDVWTLRRSQGWMVAPLQRPEAARDAVEVTAWEDYEEAGEEQYP